MKKTTIKLILVIISFSILSCEKESIEKEQSNSKTYVLEVKENGKPSSTYTYNNAGIIQELVYNDGNLTFTLNYSKDSTNNSIIVNILYNENSQQSIDSIFYKNNKIDYMISYTNTSNGWVKSNHYQLFKYNNAGQLIQRLDYDSTTNKCLTLNYQYNNYSNINYKYYPLETGFPEDSIYYDSKKSINSIIKFPQINELTNATNNIIKIKRKIKSYNAPNYTVTESIVYTSTFEYDSNNFPTKEIRKYSDTNIDTLTFSIKEKTLLNQ